MFSGFRLFPRRSGSSARFLFALLVGLPLVTAGVLAAPPPSAAQTPGCKGDACRILTPLLQSLTGAGPNCRGWLNAEFWKRATAKDVRRCMARGYRTDMQRRGGVSVLFTAASHGKGEAVKALIEAGADIEPWSRNGSTPLHTAAYVGNAGTLKVLIEAGARIEAKEQRGRTPLHAAAQGGRSGTAQILLASGARTDTRDRFGQTPADLAMSQGKTNVARMIRAARARAAERPKPEAETMRPTTAPAPGRTTEVPRRAAGGGGGCRGWLASYFWRRASEADVRRCLAAGSRPDARNANGSTPLHWAAYVNNAAAVKALVDAGANVDARDARNRTPAHSAASGGAEAAVRALLAAGADVSARSADGRTPADEARSKNNTRVANLLGASGGRTATAAPPPPRNATASPSAAERAVQVFEKTKRRASGSQKLRCAPQHQEFWKKALPEDIRRCVEAKTKVLYSGVLRGASAEQIAAAIEAGENPDSKKHGSTLLYMAVEYRNLGAVKALLAGGANVNARHDDTSTHSKRWTPLHMASDNTRRKGTVEAEIVKALLAAGAKVDAQDSWDQTALHLASSIGYEKVVKMLIAAGARVDLTDRRGRTPMDVASRNVKQVLLAGGAGPACSDWKSAEFWKAAMAKHVRRCLARGKSWGASRGASMPNLLGMAALHGRPETVTTLIEARAKVDAKSECRMCKYVSDGKLTRYEDEGTALHLAVLGGKTGNAEALVAAGADVTARDKFQLNPLELAKATGKTEVAEILSGARRKQYERKKSVARECGNWAKSEFWKYGSAADVKRCVRAGKKVGARNEIGATRLHLAAHRGDVEIMKTLISSGARIQSRDKYGRTPLHYAAQYGTPGAIEVLLDAKANAKAKNKDDKSPFDLAEGGPNRRVEGTDAYWRLNEALHE